MKYTLKIGNKYVKSVMGIIKFTKDFAEAATFTAFAISKIESKYPAYEFEKEEV